MLERVSPTREIIITRVIRASPARVYAAFTSARGWCAWCCEQAEVDARIGGKLHIYTEGYNAFGEFTILSQDRRVAFTWDGDNEPPTAIDVLIDDQKGCTNIIFRVSRQGSEEEWLSIVAFLERIWNHVLDNLKDVLEKTA